MNSGPIAGIVMLDIATLFAGPLAAMILGDFGADVIKISTRDMLGLIDDRLSQLKAEGVI